LSWWCDHEDINLPANRVSDRSCVLNASPILLLIIFTSKVQWKKRRIGKARDQSHVEKTLSRAINTHKTRTAARFKISLSSDRGWGIQNDSGCETIRISHSCERSILRQMEHIFLWNNIISPSKSSFNRAQQELFEVIKVKCLIECANRRQEVFPGSTLAFDGSWSHCRGAMECIDVFIDCPTEKIVDFEILQKSKCRLLSDHAGSSSGMEVAAVQNLIERRKNNTNVVGCVHDCNSKASKPIREAD
jgi:hypothetical protein